MVLLLCERTFISGLWYTYMDISMSQNGESAEMINPFILNRLN